MLLKRPLDSIEHRVLVRGVRHAMIFHEGVQPGDQPGVVCRKVDERAHLACVFTQETARQLVIILVDLGLLSVRDVGRFEICTFDETDRRTERQQRLDITRRAIQIGLKRDANLRRPRARAPEQLQRRIDAGRALHVDPHEVTALGGTVHQPLQVPVTEFFVEIEAELRRFDRDLRVDSGRVHFLEHVQVVFGHPFGFVDAGEVLAEVGQDRRDALGLLSARGKHGVFEALAGHEPRHRAAYGWCFRRPFAKPGAGGCGQQDVSRKTH